MSGNLYLKWTRTGRVPAYQGGEPIPVGEWTATAQRPVPCKRGWHACRWDDAIHHISDELWVCELDGRIVEGRDKVAASRLRLVEQVTAIDARALRLFAADCAERALPIFERERPDDGRPREAIRVARLYADGQATGDELVAAWAAASDAVRAAERKAARDAALAAARTATGAAAWAAWAAGAVARNAAGSAAGAAAWDTAGAAWAAWAAGATARNAGRWQTDRLLSHYGGLNPDLFARKGVRP